MMLSKPSVSVADSRDAGNGIIGSLTVLPTDLLAVALIN
jgi:hypothetical protein